MDEILLILVALFASTVSGIIGFGGGIILVGLGALFTDIKLLIVVATTVFLVINVSKIGLFWKNMNWKIAIYMTLGCIPFVILGAKLMIDVPEKIITRILGVVIITYVAFRTSNRHKTIKKMRELFAFFGGATFGFISGLVGAGGAPKIATLDLLGLRKEALVATSSFVTMFASTIKIIIYQRSIDISEYRWWFWILFLSTGFIGPYVGKKYLKAMCPHVFQKIMLGFLAIIGVRFLVF